MKVLSVDGQKVTTDEGVYLRRSEKLWFRQAGKFLKIVLRPYKLELAYLAFMGLGSDNK